jgi:hypothetical protein
VAEGVFTGEPPEAIARFLATKGAAGVEQMQAIVDRARAMVIEADWAFADPPISAVARFEWEADDDPPPEGPASVWIGSMEDYSTGEGLSVYFVAAFAHSENGFRRYIARELGTGLADRACVRKGVEGSVPCGSMFLTDCFRSSLRAFDRGEGRPAAMSFVARFRANYS